MSTYVAIKEVVILESDCSVAFKLSRMKRTLFRAILSAVILPSLLATSCKDASVAEGEPIEITPLYMRIVNYPGESQADREIDLDSMKPVLAAMSNIFNENLTTDSALLGFARRPMNVMFAPAVEQILTPERMDSVERVAGISFGRLRERFPDIRIPRIYGIVTPYLRKIYMVDTVMFVSLNHFLGAGFTGYSEWPEFRRRVSRLSLMPYNIIEAYTAITKPYKPTVAPTALSRIIYAGMLAELKMQVVPDSKLHDAMSYDPDQLEWLEKNEQMMWRKMIEGDMIYATNTQDIDRLVLQRHNSDFIHPDAPGHVGTYIGYKIVKAYLAKHPETTVADMFKPEFYSNPQLLRESGYAGK